MSKLRNWREVRKEIENKLTPEELEEIEEELEFETEE